ncbi:unannotated protein [freshwater metagenome]|uniref:Unannotated protein n=1 Tax=freshwater metagenome TaxID=449393 RepID=A0A6J7EC65_9ZZZZ
MPARKTHTPRRIPNELSSRVSSNFPQRPIRVEALSTASLRIFFDGKASARLERIKLVATDGPVIVNRASIEVHRTIATDVGVRLVHQGLDQFDHQINGF